MNIFNVLTSCRHIQTAWMPEYAAYMIEGELKSSFNSHFY